MENDSTTYMIYDKYAGTSHTMMNPLTQNITIDSLFSKGIPYLEGDQAIKKYLDIAGVTNDPLKEEIDLSVYNVLFFEVLESGGQKAYVTLIAIDNKKFMAYFNKHNTVACSKFFIQLCKFHGMYNGKSLLLIQSYSHIVDSVIKAVMIPPDTVIETTDEQPNFINVNMYSYQKRTLKWLNNVEKTSKCVHISKDMIRVADVAFDNMTKKICHISELPLIQFSGGALIDEVGLGKTLQMLAMSLQNPGKNVVTRNDMVSDIKSRATLVVCPNQLAGQWIREIEKVIKKSKELSIIPFFTKVHFDKYSYNDLLNADFVIVSFNFFDNPCFIEKVTSGISTKKSYFKSEPFLRHQVMLNINKIRDTLIKDSTKLNEKQVVLPCINWHRIIVDEIHEIYTVSKYSYMKNIIQLLSSKYRWCVTGTPFDKDDVKASTKLKPDFLIEYSLDHIINFVAGSYQNGGLLRNDIVYDHIVSNFFRRNTKKNIEEEMKLPELKQKTIWLRFSQTERAIYNAFLANDNVDRFGKLLRQLCCHPKIADDIKYSLNNCKTLDDIEKTMVSHYKQDLDAAKCKKDGAEYRLARIERRLVVATYYRQRMFLRKLKYRVRVELPAPILKPGHVMDEMIEGDSPSYSTSDSDDDKPLIIVNADNQALINSLVGKSMAKEAEYIKLIQASIENAKINLDQVTKEYAGKMTTYSFYTNMLDRIKKATEKTDKDEDDVCGICLADLGSEEIGVTKCGHIFCYQCLNLAINNKPKCPMCNATLTTKDIFMISYEAPIKKDCIIKEKMELINNIGTKLANLIFYLNSIKDHVIIFSQWDDLLLKVGQVLSDCGIRNVFCRGNVWQRDKAIRDFNSDDTIKVIMLSSESAASGTNLTRASKVILLDPVMGTREHRRNTEWQAVGRAYRIGQQNSVEVVRFIIRDTVEEDIYNMNMKEDPYVTNIEEVTWTTITEDKGLIDEICKSYSKAAEVAKEKLAKKAAATLAKNKPNGV